VTLHRPQDVDRADVLRDLIETLSGSSADLSLVPPAHPAAARGGDDTGSLRVTGPRGYRDFVALEAGASVV
jgi:hypothetical protein